MKVKEESEKVGLKLNIQKTKIMASCPITSWQIDGEIMETVRYFIFLGFKITADGDCSHKIKRCLLLGRKAMTNLDSILKCRAIYFTDKSPSSQSYGFSSGHVWMWELDYKESCAQKNWCFWTVVLEKTLESSLDCKEIQSIHSKGNQSWIFIGTTDTEAETPILWPDAKNWLIGKDPDAEKDWRWEEKGPTEDEMVGWHHWLNGHEFEQALGDGDRLGSLACCSPWGCKESDKSQQLNWLTDGTRKLNNERYRETQIERRYNVTGALKTHEGKATDKGHEAEKSMEYHELSVSRSYSSSSSNQMAAQRWLQHPCPASRTTDITTRTLVTP